ncbi:MAG: DUF2238 domain-containing protein [Anaerolineae bacterium]|nr:DUF2238 domain-containing protein [Anaerolineae bacterium]
MGRDRRLELWLLIVVLAIFGWSAAEPRDWFTWFLEILPVIIGLVLLGATYRRFRFTALAYLLIALHAGVLMVGAHYTYGEMPLFNWLQEGLGLERNYYDRLGHVAQGFFPAIVAREILIRLSPLNPGRWLNFLVLCVCLAISAAYELVEWGVAMASGSAAVAFLATQGDPWDTHWDMLLALVGAVASLMLLSRAHDRALRRRQNKCSEI